jgi:hypothetical protein
MRGVGPALAEKLEKLGVTQVQDLLFVLPSRYEDRTQILEIGIFLFANVLVAGACLLWFGQKMDPSARPWLIAALVLVPALAALLHPRIFYTAVNAILRKAGKPPITQRLRGRSLVKLAIFMIAGLILQSFCVYLIADPVLHFKTDWWWVIAGAYCLAWVAGFLAFWAPAGIGVRELVFVTTMQVTMPQHVKDLFGNPAALQGLLVLLGFLLRLWTVLGELMLAIVAYAWDWRGAMNRDDAPGRVPRELLEAEAIPAPSPTPGLSPAVAQSPAQS